MALRQEIHGIIDDIPERNLFILRPLLDFLTDKNTADDSLSSEELRLLEQCRKDRKERPENLKPWRKVRGETAATVMKER
ncbi:MAG: hypothetical protein LBK66_14180 [Spirochaetaceae bacterium]|jgi:hypothetical protein|nr:hypothetical protein [Spirochaetaceae bacterium]